MVSFLEQAEDVAEACLKAKEKSNEANLPWAALQRKYYTLRFQVLMCETLLFDYLKW